MKCAEPGMKKCIVVILLILVILSICFIWVQSCLSVESSAQESYSITVNIIQKIEQFLTGRITISENAVRKLAHVAEFFVLGIELGILFYYGKRRIIAGALSAFSVGACIAFLDESIQLLSGRGAEITDVWIDMTGLFFSIVICMIVEYIIELVAKKKRVIEG